MPLTAAQTRMANVIYSLARQGGLNDARARELIAASIAESGLNPSIRNTSSGATGLFQLLSSGYVRRATQLGGVTNPRANTLAILPDYVNYWRSHPGARPGEAARDVERSGEGAGFYSGPLSQLAGYRPGSVSADPGAAAPTSALTPQAAAPDLTPLRRAALQQLIGRIGSNPTTNYSGFLGALRDLHTAQTAATTGGATDNASLGEPPPATVASPRPSAGIKFVGASISGLQPAFVRAVSQAARAAGATQVKLTSGYRSPQHNAAVGGVPRSNHMTGNAMDAYGYVPGRGWIPLGTLLKTIASRFGLRSGDQPGFYHGGVDTVHVDFPVNQR